MGPAEVVEHLRRAGGISTYRSLLADCSRHAVRRALDEGRIARDARGRYALPTADHALREANRLTAMVGYLSAAAYWGLPLKSQPSRPQVIVPRNRRIRPGQAGAAKVYFRDLASHDVWDRRVTAPLRTVIDCALTLPFDEALAVADSALREQIVERDALARAAVRLAGRGRQAAIRVATEADPRAANPFESVLRAVSLAVPGLRLEPQLVVSDGGFRCRPDLVDRALGIVVEADSFEFHGARRQLARDCRRYNELAVRDRLVLRFSWEQVMHEQDWVVRILTEAAHVARIRVRRQAA